MAFADDAPVHLLKKKASRQRSKAAWSWVGKKKYYFRSEWERKYACFLEWRKVNKQIKSWKYEPRTFWFLKIKRGVRSYKPDFRVVENDGRVYWAEIKGWMDQKSKTKLNRMKKYYPKVEVHVVGQNWFHAAGQGLGGVVPGWETKNV